MSTDKETGPVLTNQGAAPRSFRCYVVLRCYNRPYNLIGKMDYHWKKRHNRARYTMRKIHHQGTFIKFFRAPRELM